ncbi:hypothetical protein CVT25_001901 [Psilocybe cyanescens]|uniref:RanBD1 domain-containing protein n=1 Tax=Psilocybe cyanescens TaxID=93625 RepID=A0A409WQV2_PSICY|nr:hypothetical protein CVT25_001901 [Psilocybe cyanescens]
MNKAFSEGDNNADGRDPDPEDGAQQANLEEIEEVLLKLWLWTAFEDLSEPIPTKRVFAVRFASAENALKFKKVFDEAPKKDSSSITNHVEVKSQLDLLRLERERIDRQITMLEQRGGDGAR